MSCLLSPVLLYSLISFWNQRLCRFLGGHKSESLNVMRSASGFKSWTSAVQPAHLWVWSWQINIKHTHTSRPAFSKHLNALKKNLCLTEHLHFCFKVHIFASFFLLFCRTLVGFLFFFFCAANAERTLMFRKKHKAMGEKLLHCTKQLWFITGAARSL